ncbi:putative f-box domain protein [Erysiphe necator]|uniref:Putative f-box domain protein n=1 Tax=Uncinula necator TaxID=52586 RepID=A0A0B1P8S1_UNCNE|nr:putative f-box domain protein [Erysiphe necator]
MEYIQSTTKFNNIFNKVPHELCLKIVDELYLEDLLRLRLVCQSWYQVFCSIDICVHAIKKYFSLPIDYYFQKSGHDYAELDDSKKKEEWLRKFIINRIRREHGIATRSFELDYNLWRGFFNFRYSNGRVVFQDEHGFTVEDLTTRQQFIFASPLHAVLLTNWQLSDRYLLVPFAIYSSGPISRELVAWDLASKRMHSIRIDEKVESLSAYQNQVGIVTVSSVDMTDSFESYVWQVGGALTRLQQIKHKRNSSEEKIVAIDIFFHIFEKDVIFLVYHSCMSSSFKTGKHGTRITVQCFEAGVHTQTQYETIYTSTKPEDHRSVTITNDNIICIEVWENPELGSNKDSYTHVTYDMGRRKFNRLEVHLHPISGRNLLEHKNLIWRDQIYNPFLEGIFGEMRELHVITLSKSLTDIWFGPSQSTCYTKLSFMKSSLLCSETRENCVSTKNLKIYDTPTGWSRRAWGDDSFLIANLGGSLRVWQFDNLGLEPSR